MIVQKVLLISILILSVVDSALGQGLYYLWNGENAEKDRNPDLAISRFTLAIKSGTLNQQEFARAYRGRGSAYAVKREFSRALQDLEKATEFNPEFGEAFMQLGLVQMNLKEFDLAINSFERVIQLNPKY